jgi:hypothetical protein
MRRPIVNRRNRRNFDPSNQPGGVNALCTDVAISTVTVTLTFNQPVSLNGVPQVLSVGANGSLPTAAAQLSATQVNLTYAATQAASTDFIVPERDPAIRTYSGGFAQAGTFQP